MPELGERDRAAIGQRDVAEAVEPRRVAGEERDAWLVLARPRRLTTATSSTIAGATPSTTAMPRRGADLVRGRRGVADERRPGRRAELAGVERVRCPSCGDELVGLAEAVTADVRIVWLIVSPVVSAAAMIVVPSISPTTISARASAAARDVAQAELEQDAVADAPGPRTRRARP